MSLRNDKCPCGRKINEDKYTSKGTIDYCSDECAERLGNEGVVTPKVSAPQQYSNEWPSALVPS